jgi:hypothetical protein
MRKIWFVALAASALGAQSLPETHPLFARDEVHEFHLRFAQSDWYPQLLSNFNQNSEDVPYIEASFRWRDVAFDKVGVRIKGNSTARVNSLKKPLRIKFNEFTKGQKIEGIGSINLNNMNMDPSMVRESPYFDMARAAGMKAPRMNYAALYINNEFWGLYYLCEVINDDYLKHHFVKEQRDGWLYKGDIGSTFEDLGDDKSPYKRTFEKKTHEDEDDWSDLVALVAALNRTPKEQLAAELEKVLDIDSFLTALALDNMTVNLDSYVGMAQNFYIYRRPADNRFEWLVWDPSLAFGAFSGGLNTEQLKTLPLEWVTTGRGPGGGGPPPGIGPGAPPPGLPPPGGGGPGFGSQARPLATKLWEVPEIKARYTRIYRKLVEEVFHVDKILARMNTLRTMIRPWVERDPNKLNTLEQFDAAMTQEAAAPAPGGPGFGPGGAAPAPALDPFLKARLESVKQQLAERE